jgi:hypothetical protein
MAVRFCGHLKKIIEDSVTHGYNRMNMPLKDLFKNSETKRAKYVWEKPRPCPVFQDNINKAIQMILGSQFTANYSEEDKKLHIQWKFE